MVTKKEQNDVIVGPKGAMLIAFLMLAIGGLIWMAATNPHSQQFAAYDQSQPSHVVETSRSENQRMAQSSTPSQQPALSQEPMPGQPSAPNSNK